MEMVVIVNCCLTGLLKNAVLSQDDALLRSAYKRHCPLNNNLSFQNIGGFMSEILKASK